MRRIGLAVAVAVSVSGAAWAQSGALKPDEYIALRQAGMAMVGGLMGVMKAGVASGADPKVFADGVSGIGEWAESYTRLFPDGTQTGHDTKAKGEIWSNWAGFQKADQVLADASAKLLAAAKSGDKGAFAAAFADEGKACGNCHRQFKEK